MVRTKDEIAKQDISDIEEGTVKPYCFHCRKPQYREVKYLITIDNFGSVNTIKTKNETGVCVNPLCFRFTNVKETPSWVREDKASSAPK